jgi:hypothetical protein
MKPTLSTIERRLLALETQHNVESEPITLRVTVTTPGGEPHPDWVDDRHEYKDKTGRRCICIMPRQVTPEESDQQKQNQDETDSQRH